jgi:hypothetical protein
MKNKPNKKPSRRKPRRKPSQPEGVRKRRTVEEITADQNGRRPTRLEDILGKGGDLWDSDEEFEEFLDILKEAKASRRN